MSIVVARVDERRYVQFMKLKSVAIAILIVTAPAAFAHCDWINGPVVADARTSKRAGGSCMRTRSSFITWTACIAAQREECTRRPITTDATSGAWLDDDPGLLLRHHLFFLPRQLSAELGVRIVDDARATLRGVVHIGATSPGTVPHISRGELY